MDPNLPPLDLALVSSWIRAILDTVWPAFAVLLGVVVGTIIVRAFRRALAGGGE